MDADRPGRQDACCDAMATRFKITIVHHDASYARRAAAAALAELAQIEGRLSRFLEGSDVFRANRLAPGQSTRLHLDTFHCLETALDIARQTRGAFDVAYASAVPAAQGPRFELNPADRAIRILAPGTRLDLGGIGKGFALDRMAALLADWEIASALLAASSSTMLALEAPPGEPGWKIRFGSDHAPRDLWLAGRAFSASGRSAKGSHIIDPRTGQAATHWLRTWAMAPNAATADALSTAFLVMPEREIRAYCRRHPNVSAYALPSAEAALEVLHEPE